MPIRDHVVLLVNGERRDVRGGDCFLTLAEYLRGRLGLVGCKLVCSEGDCGSCSVLIGRPEGESIRYLPIDSCIRFLFQLDGTHVVTVEGLADPGKLTPIQQAMIECHGSQCGFCTPGFVMAMTAWLQQPDGLPLRTSLTGNLCRCTGYTPILEAGERAARQGAAPIDQRYPAADLLEKLAPLAADVLDLRGDGQSHERRAYCPTTIAEAVAFRAAHRDAKVVAGATDVGVQWNKRSIGPTVFLDLNRVAELEGVTIEQEAHVPTLVAGARATWTELHEAFRHAVPQFAEIISVFGSPQIRHVGTLGGNLINASPIADSLPFLYVMEAELELVQCGPLAPREDVISRSEMTTIRRRVNINDFYQGYKQFDLRSDELLARIHVPLPADDELLRLYKVSRRRDLDIATFTAAIRMRLEGETIVDAALAYGAVAPTVVRLRETESCLRGRPFDEVTMHAAGEIALGEIAPISDVRGSAEYRRRLAGNVLLKFFHEHVGVQPSGCLVR